MLSFEEKRCIFQSYPQLVELEDTQGRFAYAVQLSTGATRQIARELTHTGNGYIKGDYTEQLKQLCDKSGWIRIKDKTEAELRAMIPIVIQSLTDQTDEWQHRHIEFLEKCGLWPVNSMNWNCITFAHEKPVDSEQQKEKEQEISKLAGTRSGIYIYENPAGKILYVGKGKPIRSRLISHFRESFTTVPGDTKDNKWHRFFKSHAGTVTVYWKEVEGETNRRIVELMLDSLLRPSFSEWE